MNPMRKWITLIESSLNNAKEVKINEITLPQTRQDVNQILMAAGYKRLGTGMFAAVYEKPGSPYVLKVFSAKDNAYQDFIKLAKEHQDNPHFPKFYGKLLRITKNYFAIRMEKLSVFDPHHFGEKAYALFDYIQDGQPVAELNDEPLLREACDLVRRKLLSHYVFDHKDEAFMTREDTIVITDPALDLSAKENLRWSPEPIEPTVPKPPRSERERKEDDDLLAQLMADDPHGMLDETIALNEVININSPEFHNWFGRSKVVDKDGNPLPVYHGSARPDRVGSTFRRSRATSGPMSYFTDDPQIASGYATGKADTSFEGEDDYNGWFKVKVPGRRSVANIDQAWYYLDGSQRAKIAAMAPTVFTDDDGEIVQDPAHKNGIGNLSDSTRQSRGNVLAALVDGWLTGGNLFGEELEFLKVLKLVGFPFKVDYQDPHASQSAVFQVFLRIQNPLDTGAIPQQVITALEKASRMTRQKIATVGADAWAKKSTSPNTWMNQLYDDIETGNTHAWTTIPDWVTLTLKRLGYDGVKDTDGKHHEIQHTVWIPFEETQVKSAISSGFDPRKPQMNR